MSNKRLALSMLILAVCVSGATIAASGFPPNVLVIACALAAAALAGLAISNGRANDSASRSAVAGSTAANMAIIWFWGALSLTTIYAFIVPPWKEWWHFAAAFAILGGACLFFARIHNRDAATGKDDETMLKLGRTLSIAQLAGTLLAMAGLIIDPNKTFSDTSDPAWAANIVFFAGAAALAAASAHALLNTK